MIFATPDMLKLQNTAYGQEQVVPMSFMDRVQKLLKEKKITQVALVKGIGLSEGAFTHWKNKKSKPTADNRRSIARFLGTSVEFLETGIHKNEYPAVPLIKDFNDLEAYAVTLKESFFNPALAELAGQSKMTNDELNGRYSALEDSVCTNRYDQPSLFAWRLENDSMTSLSPEHYWPRGAEILFDPRKEPKPGSCILLAIDGRLEFRRWVEVGGCHVFTLLNSAYSQGTAINYPGLIWDVWVGTPVSYTLAIK